MLQQIFSLSFMTAFLAAAVRLAVPLMYGGIGETIAEKSGILNIGMEGVMLSGAFFSFAGAWYSGNLFVGLLCGMAGGLIVSLLHGLLSITLIQNQSVSGLAINMLMLGVTSFLFKLMSNGQGYQQIETFPNIAIPGLSKIPLIGDAFFNCDFLTYILYVLLILTWIFYKKNQSWTVLYGSRRTPTCSRIRRHPGEKIPLDRDGVQRNPWRNRRCISGTGTAWRFYGKYDFRPWLYCSCNCYSWTLHTFWNVWSSSFVRSSQCPADSSPDYRRIHFPVPSGYFAICADPYCNAWGCWKEQ